MHGTRFFTFQSVSEEDLDKVFEWVVDLYQLI